MKATTVTTLIYQLVTIVSGIAVPKVLISHYGSDIYGAATSIAQFLSYISLAEGGIGGVARAELYTPLANHDNSMVSKIYNAVKRYYKIIGGAFLLYMLVLACSYGTIAEVDFLTKDYVFFLVLVIGVSTCAQYLFGIANLNLMNAAQRRYVSNIVVTITTLLNAAFVIVLATLDVDFLVVKLCTSCIFLLNPLVYYIYVKKNFRISKKIRDDKGVLKQKWTGIGQNIAYFLHTHTDVVVLTLFADLISVAVYSVYNLVVSSLRSIVTALTSGMEAIVGDMIAKNEKKTLNRTYRNYEIMVSAATVILFSVGAILIVPFVKLYTEGVTDADYIQPAFAVTILAAEAVNCMFLPYSLIPVAANHIAQTKKGAYGEALINMGLSCILVYWNPLLGVAIGTLLSVCYKNIYYFIYVSKHILDTPLSHAKHYLFSFVAMAAMVACGLLVIDQIALSSFAQWILAALAVSAAVSILTVTLFLTIYKKDFADILQGICNKLRRNRGRR